MKDIVVACCRVAQKNPNLVVDEQSKDFWKWRDTILQNEDVLLEVLCFDLTIEPPHKQLYEMLKFYGVQNNKPLRNTAWAFVTDSNQTQLCLVCSTRTIAAAALYCAARNGNIAFPDTRGLPWWEVQHVRLRDMLIACNYMAANYENAPGKAGPDGAQSIYVGFSTPLPSDDGHSDGHPMPWEATRLKFEQAIHSPAPQLLDFETSRRNSTSSQGSKRPFDLAAGEDHADENDPKRRRTPSQLPIGRPPSTYSSSARPPQPPPPPESANHGSAGDDGSEEGEVEE